MFIFELINKIIRLFVGLNNLGFAGYHEYRKGARRLQALPKGKTLAFRPANLIHPCHLRARSSDVDVFFQICLLGEYGVLSLPKNARVLDLGANIGLSSCWFLSRFSRSQVAGVEPDAENYEMLLRNTRPYGERFRGICAAIGKTTGRSILDSKTGRAGSEFSRQFVDGMGDNSVPRLSMEDCLDEFGLAEIDLLKVDVEGAETELFSGNPTWLGRVHNVVIEVHGDDARRVVDHALKDRARSHIRSHELDVFQGLIHT